MTKQSITLIKSDYNLFFKLLIVILKMYKLIYTPCASLIQFIKVIGITLHKCSVVFNSVISHTSLEEVFQIFH